MIVGCNRTLIQVGSVYVRSRDTSVRIEWRHSLAISLERPYLLHCRGLPDPTTTGDISDISGVLDFTEQIDVRGVDEEIS